MSEPRFVVLAAAIDAELANLDALQAEMAGLLPRLGVDAGSFDRRAAGSILQDFYNGLERIFERIAFAFDGGAPGGPASHSELLRQMARPVTEARPALIDPTTAEILDQYLPSVAAGDGKGQGPRLSVSKPHVERRRSRGDGRPSKPAHTGRSEMFAQEPANSGGFQCIAIWLRHRRRRTVV